MNTGNDNSGYSNSGYWNSGNSNSGYWNSGNSNSGYWNSGNWNSGNWNSGCFNTDEPNARFFNKDTTIKMSEFYSSERCPSSYGFYLTKWVDSSKMTDQEKEDNLTYKTCGGYLKTYTYEEAWANFWKDTTEENRQKFLNLPNFSAKIFKEITGIDTEEKMIKLSNGKKVSESTVMEALRALTEVYKKHVSKQSSGFS